MKKSIETTSLYLDIHSIIKVWAPDIPKEICNFLNKRLGSFTLSSYHNPEEADILLLQLKENPMLDSSLNRWNSLYGFWFTEYEKQLAIVFNYKGKSDVVIIFSKVIKILYTNRPKMSRRLYGILLFCLKLAINSKNGVLFHGAIARKGNNSVLLTGHRGTRKTMLLLTMLKNGWDYLSDDKFVLHNHNAYLFQNFIALQDHHFEALPWLREKMPVNRRFSKLSALLRKNAGTFAQKHVHKHLLHGIDRFCNPSVHIQGDELFPSCKILNSVRPSTVIALFTGPVFNIEVVSKTDIIDELALIMRLISDDSNALECMLALYDSRFRYNMKEIIADNLNKLDFYKLTIPNNCDVDWVFQEVNKCLKQVS